MSGWDSTGRYFHGDVGDDPPHDDETCIAPGCENGSLYLGMCEDHAAEEFGPQYPSISDIVGPL